MSLHKLTNGNYVDLKHVSAIEAIGTEVYVDLVGGQTQGVRFESDKEAEAYRDQLAEAINQKETPNEKEQSKSQ